MKLKFIRNRAMLKVTNSIHDTVTFNPVDMLGVVDLRSLGYYKIKQGVLQQNLSNMYHFETANTVCDQFNRLIYTPRREEKTKGAEKYPWLDDSDERKLMQGFRGFEPQSLLLGQPLHCTSHLGLNC